MAHHEEKQYSIFQIAMNLTMACLVSGAIIAAVYYVTAPVAAENAIKMKNEAMKTLVADAEGFKKIEGKEDWYEAQKGGETIAYVVQGESKGFGGEIKLLVAVTKDGKVMDYAILAHNETPGLGDKAGVDPFKAQFKGKESKSLEVTKDPSNKENIQALTGATITSRAVTKGIKEVVDEVVEYAGGK